jgi:hypothetical protein
MASKSSIVTDEQIKLWEEALTEAERLKKEGQMLKDSGLDDGTALRTAELRIAELNKILSVYRK